MQDNSISTVQKFSAETKDFCFKFNPDIELAAVIKKELFTQNEHLRVWKVRFYHQTNINKIGNSDEKARIGIKQRHR